MPNRINFISDFIPLLAAGSLGMFFEEIFLKIVITTVSLLVGTVATYFLKKPIIDFIKKLKK